MKRQTDRTFLVVGGVIAAGLVAWHASGVTEFTGPEPGSAWETMRTPVGPDVWLPLVLAAVVLAAVLHSPKLGMNPRGFGCAGQGIGLVAIGAMLLYFYVMVFGRGA